MEFLLPHLFTHTWAGKKSSSQRLFEQLIWWHPWDKIWVIWVAASWWLLLAGHGAVPGQEGELQTE